MADEIQHKLKMTKIDTAKATLCGIEVNAIYPHMGYALPAEAGQRQIAVTFFGKVTCEACKKKDKEG